MLCPRDLRFGRFLLSSCNTKKHGPGNQVHGAQNQAHQVPLVLETVSKAGGEKETSVLPEPRHCRQGRQWRQIIEVFGEGSGA